MAVTRYRVYASSGGSPVTGLSPTLTLAKLADGTAVSSPPTVFQLSSTNAPGWYVFDYDPAASGQAVGRVDLGNGNFDAGRYIPVDCK